MDGYILSSDNETFLFERAKSILGKSTGFEIHAAVSLAELIKSRDMNIFTLKEQNFLKSASRVDVVITNGYGRRKVTLALESDSSFHDTTKQRRRDALKDAILRKACIPLMRFRSAPHYVPNEFGEIFVDAVLESIANQAFVIALGMQAYRDAENTDGEHPVFLTLPFKREFSDLASRAEEIAESGNIELEFLKDWAWDDEANDVSYNRQMLLGNKKSLAASTGKCDEREFKYGAYAAAELFAQMGCLYKYLINQKVIRPERRPFLEFLSDEMNRTPPEILNPPPW